LNAAKNRTFPVFFRAKSNSVLFEYQTRRPIFVFNFRFLKKHIVKMFPFLDGSESNSRSSKL